MSKRERDEALVWTGPTTAGSFEYVFVSGVLQSRYSHDQQVTSWTSVETTFRRAMQRNNYSRIWNTNREREFDRLVDES